MNNNAKKSITSIYILIQQHFTYFSLIAALLIALTSCSEQTPALKPLTNDAIILSFGDSLTYGTGANQQQSYPAVLSGLIGRKVIRSGIPGELSKDGLLRLPDELEHYQPDLLILCHGGNDMLRKHSRERTKYNLTQMIQLAKQHGIQVLLLGVPEPGLFLSTAEIYFQIAESENIPIEDNIIADILETGELKSDRVHPNAAGYQKIAQAVEQLLVKSGAISK